MSAEGPTPPYGQEPSGHPAFRPPPPGYQPQGYQPQGYQPQGYQPQGQQVAPYGTVRPAVGTVRSTGICILLSIVTLGIYHYVWWYKVHAEMKRHTGEGIGGGIALVLAIFVGIAMPYITSSEVGGLYTRRGQRPPVTGLTGLWYFPGAFIIVGPLIWFVKTNSALNAYWQSVGAAR